ncbi:LAMI_0H16864g1_1 [Lachancea mirantina]|uniref:Defective in cullin neddylation protein n=1 Tax=Lachancea mirantina TaxID=1230905 RepID=A0A1G4KJ65_9SACH|nr:LAMI_0H16864g1_1 [Lachancea mirantina]
MSHSSLENEFIALTKCNRTTARSYLSRNQWAMDYALNDYYDTEHGTFVEATYPPELVAVFKLNQTTNGPWIEPEDFVKFVSESLHYNPEDAAVLCLADLLDLKSFENSISEEEFLSHWAQVNCYTLEHMRSHLEACKEKMRTDISYFSRIYNSAFDLALDRGRKSVSINTAVAYWELLFLSTAHYAVKVDPIRIQSWIEFVSESAVESITKDAWQQFLVFIIKYPTNELLKSSYNPMAAWPVLIDEYYEHLEETGLLD